MRAVKVVDYDPSWPVLFAEIRAEISTLLGDLLLSIDHIGSTSVPGLAAKPKVDLDVVTISDEVLPTAIDAVRATDFVFHGDIGEKAGPSPGITTVVDSGSIFAALVTARTVSASCFATISGITRKEPRPMPT
ncbi:GrpB-like predicted nucleotidyltransferase (UPF0157 family) [Rhizobium leguminosarum]|uniref:GrpB-like predicted nucleotidyltransferase (UPF0157 family) n=1 Tax=Rhizobium leguminosarum TaxID=384 RepID=A0AAE2SZH3_RHILE|nr:GrpB-like predicted nucleotidyltransferase (UPF0157 family) [Rhizobium leguminosarum]MBB4435613.1 GrpB-like predicted nucleotidyltransferase (UPF0157 family) [Rhizobium esperanzae]MBB4295994.1 GrpB-like predicted nucleotidyltransferase (UPF0157 family) [Rhizobium leguminosarum]MBB4311343.1 GrpB-like predicted nucleotidyltransferase (UPF0157 family) [Rhizobium leguminosarum]MBB4420219.1 GrpB-like predicted nucleotidyltransferase (UPF0157 family) [Rhizobium leguminosarum]